MNRTEFEAALRKLVAQVGARSENRGCLACERCVAVDRLDLLYGLPRRHSL